MSSGIKLSQNRFAALYKDPDSDLKVSKKSKKRNDSDPGSQHQFKNNKKGNQCNKSSTSKQPQKQKKKNASQVKTCCSPTSSARNDDDWERRDEKLVEKLFHDDMSKAIELSKQEYEKQEQTKQLDKKTTERSSSNTSCSKWEEKKDDRDVHKEKKLRSAKAISLKEFHRQVEKTLPLKNESSAKAPSSESSSVKPCDTNGSGDYFSTIDKEVSKIEQKECRKRNQHQAIPASAISLATVFENERTSEKISENEKRIGDLEEELQSWKDKFHHVKKRNQQLLVMLQQGEMKEKADLLLEVERLSVIRDELTDEIAELHGSLEKERSKVSKLKDELQTTSRHKK